jgi:creatinine amidohydrolase/Fe(II)-dependent formamide hydrolase-like protein
MAQNFNLENLLDENILIKKVESPFVDKSHYNETIEEFQALDQHLGNQEFMEEVNDGNYVEYKNLSVQITQLK